MPEKRRRTSLLGGLVKLVFLAFLAVVGIGVLGSMMGRRPANQPAPAPPPAVSPAPTAQRVNTPIPPRPIAVAKAEDDPIGPGKTVTLSRPGGAGNTIMAVDKPSFLALLDAQAANRFADYRRLSEGDKIRGVVNGTRATVMSAEGGGRVVRVTEGPQDGFVGWVEAQYVHPDQAPAMPAPLTEEDEIRRRAEAERRRTIELRKEKRAARRANQPF